MNDEYDQQISYNISFGMIYILLATVSNPPTEVLFVELSQRFQQRLGLSDDDAEIALVVIQDLFYTIDDPEIVEGALSRSIQEILTYAKNHGGLQFLEKVHQDLTDLSLADAEISLEEQLLLDRIAHSWELAGTTEKKNSLLDLSSDDMTPEEAYQTGVMGLCLIGSILSNPITDDLLDECVEKVSDLLELDPTSGTRIKGEMNDFFEVITEADEADKMMADFFSEMDSILSVGFGFDDSEEESSSSSEEETSEDESSPKLRDIFVETFAENFQRFSSMVVSYAENNSSVEESKEQLRSIHTQLRALALQDGILSREEEEFLNMVSRQWKL